MNVYETLLKRCSYRIQNSYAYVDGYAQCEHSSETTEHIRVFP